MINLIKNEILKVFKRRKIWIILIILFIYTIFINFINKRVDIENNNYHDSYIETLKEDLKNIDIKTDLYLYIDILNQIENYEFLENYDKNSWEYYIAEQKAYNYISIINNIKYTDNDKKSLEKANKEFEQFKEKLKGTWEEYTIEEIKTLEQELKDSQYTIKKTEDSKNDITVTIDEVLDKNHIKKLSQKIEKEYNTDTDIYTVSKVVKQELTKNAIKSLLFASIGILIYVACRFKFNYAISALVALLHDVVMIILFFCIFKLEITSIFIAAILTIIGYSINDTIVTFDMIRENYKKKLQEKYGKKKRKNTSTEPKLTDEELIDLVNDSVRITFTRSILTTLTTIFPVICLLLFGAKEIFNFNIALLVGFIAGVYSSIYISNQLWLILESRRLKKPQKKDDSDKKEVSEIEIKGVNC